MFVYAVNLLAKKTATGASLLKTGLQQKVKACFLIGLMVKLCSILRGPFPLVFASKSGVMSVNVSRTRSLAS